MYLDFTMTYLVSLYANQVQHTRRIFGAITLQLVCGTLWLILLLIDLCAGNS